MYMYHWAFTQARCTAHCALQVSVANYFTMELWSRHMWTTETQLSYSVGSCESFFSVRIESRIESAGAQTTVVYTLHLQRIFNPSVFCICDEREWCTDYGTPNWVLVYFNSVIKRVKQCCCTLILLPKSSTLNANLTTTNRFFTNDDW